MQRIAVLGARGQLGSDLMPLLGPRGVALGHDQIELTDADGLAHQLDAIKPEAVVNCAAYNHVDKAEDEPERAFAVNSFGVRNLALWCGKHDVPLMHISTDYVFGLDVSKPGFSESRASQDDEARLSEKPGFGPRCGPWNETDPTGPVSVYGGSKLAGEWFVRSLCPRHWIVRTCGLYGANAARGKGNFVETMLRLGRERPELRVVADQRCTPTSTADLAPALVDLLATEQYGVYHATNAGECSWHEFAVEIFRLSGLSPRVIPITAAEYGAKARRPDYSVLNNVKLREVIGRELRPWQDALRDYLSASINS